MKKKAIKSIFSIITIIFFIFAVFFIQRILFLTPTTGEQIVIDDNLTNSALLVVDMQNDTTGTGSIYGDTTDFINNVNTAIDIAIDKNMEVIYIQQEYNMSDFLISFGKYQKGSEGVNLDKRLRIASDKT